MIPSDRFACQPIGIVVLCPGFIGIYINFKFFCSMAFMCKSSDRRLALAQIGDQENWRRPA